MIQQHPEMASISNTAASAISHLLGNSLVLADCSSSSLQSLSWF
jgi:hypothetical protein